jgi:hypothetical protein
MTKKHTLVANGVRYEPKTLLRVSVSTHAIPTPYELERQEWQETIDQLVEEGLMEVIGEQDGAPHYAITEMGRAFVSRRK